MSNETTKREETVAEIVAEMRGNFYRDGKVDKGAMDCMKRFADRIEAAAKREELRWAKANGELARMIDLEKAQGGNAAKLREALQNIIDLERKMQEGINRAGYATGGEAGHYFYRAVQVAKAALAAPPRNCDRPEVKTLEDAIRISADAAMGKQKLHDMAYNQDLFLSHWLLAPATPEKGGEE